jgi:hypothetical protein
MHASLPGLPLSVWLRPNRMMVAALLCFSCATILAQSANTNYTADYPSVERVKAEIKGSDPADTLARQVGVLTYLSTQIQRIKLNRDYRGPYTPDETRLMTAYNDAAYQITQDYNKSHTPAEAQAFDRLQFNYTIDGEFRKDWTKRLIGPQGQAAYKGAQTDLAANQQRHYNQEMQTYNDAKKQQEAADKNPAGLSNDPTAVATRRCLELGGDPTACMGKSFVGGLLSMVGMDSGTMQAITGPGRSGVVLSGLYHNPNTLAAISFSDNTAAIQDCGKLVADGHGYTIHKSPAALDVVIQNEPRPIQLSMRPDGALAGPGPVDVKGRIIVGYHTVTSQAYLNGAPVFGNNCNGPCTTTTQVPDYAPKIERCTVATLAPPPPNPPASASNPQAGGMIGALTGMMATIAPVSEPGLRMVGKYSSSSGLLLDFGGDAVTLDCAQAHVKQPYTVENSPTQLLVHVHNSGGPFTLAVAADDTLRGSGSTVINGRLVSGMQGDSVTFTPTSSTCEIGSLRPATGSAPGTSVAASPAAADPTPPVTHVAASAPASPAMPTSSAPAASSAAGSARLLITSAFTSGANPLVGRTIFLMKDTYDNVLRKIGAPIPPGTTPGKAMQAWAQACRPPADCRAATSAMTPYFAGRATVDSSGQAIIAPQVPPGPYFVSVATPISGGVLVWNVKVDLKPGENSLVLDPRSAETVH